MKTKKELSEMTKKELIEELMKFPELEKELEKNINKRFVEEQIFKRMNDINTFQCSKDNELYLRGTDEWGQEFTICFDAFDFLEWIDTEQLTYIKQQVAEYIQTK